MKLALFLSFLLAGCGAPGDRLSDGQAEPRQNRAIDAPDGLAVTRWTVTAINGRATPGGQDYFINFTASGLQAKFGCNAMGGPWRLNGDHLSTTELAQTAMGCPEPAASLERLASAILGSNMRIERVSGTAMRLVSEAGSIDLRRAL